MASPAPLIAPRDGIVEALKKVVGGDLIAHVFAVGEDSITVRREAVAASEWIPPRAAEPSVPLRTKQADEFTP